MRFGLLYELQLPRPWDDRAEHRMIHEALAEVEIADRLGFDYLWANEHHFLEEYSHSSAPEVFLAAAAARTKQIHVGHAVVLSPPGYNPPARVAERIATLDLVSSGRCEWGTGASSSRTELEGFGVDAAQKKAMWAEATEQTANMLAMTPYPGFEGQFFSMPTRNVIPKPYQKPHPPLWVACSNRETIHVAARNGIGALAFAFVDPAEAAKWAGEYYEIIKSDECVPIGHSVNANIAMATGFSVHPDEAEAKARGGEGFQYFGFALGHFYVYGQHKPGVTNVWERFEQARPALPEAGAGNGIGTPAQLVERLRQYQDAGVDQVIFIQQAGRNQHAHIIDALELFAAEVMPALQADRAEREARKQAELAPFIEAALKRKKWMQPLAPEQVPSIAAYGRTVVAGGPVAGALAARRGGGIEIPTEDLAEKVRATGD
ncbi:MAG TPA: LLM class flavin-dependent oxidoreductase [Acetobacteraceae bacterium]|nr:LLM class flavin-dependent oxidoreductase [Acetobacteraceae bacterium]